MNEYFLGLIIFAFFGAIIFSLVPEGMSKRYVRLLCGLCSIGCIAFPIFELAGGGIDVEKIVSLFENSTEIDENSVEIYNSSLNSAAVKNACDSIKNEIIKGTSAKYDDIDIRIITNKNGDEFYIEKVSVLIYPSGYALDPDRIVRICERRLGRGCEIIYK